MYQQVNSIINGVFSVGNIQLISCDKLITKVSGIYAIFNKITKDIYVGKSVNIKNRWAEHISNLKHNKCVYRNGEPTLLQKAYNKYGKENFEFFIIEYCTIDQLNDSEKYWIKKLNCNRLKSGFGYNLTDGGDGVARNNNKNKILINNGEIQKFVPLNDLNYYVSQGWEKGMSEKTLKNFTKLRYKGQKKQYKKKSEEELLKSKMVKALKLKGQKRSDEVKKKMSAAKFKKVVQFDKDGNVINIFNSMKEAAQKTNIPITIICNWCKGKKKLTKNTKFMWRYYN